MISRSPSISRICRLTFQANWARLRARGFRSWPPKSIGSLPVAVDLSPLLLHGCGAGSLGCVGGSRHRSPLRLETGTIAKSRRSPGTNASPMSRSISKRAIWSRTRRSVSSALWSASHPPITMAGRPFPSGPPPSCGARAGSREGSRRKLAVEQFEALFDFFIGAGHLLDGVFHAAVAGCHDIKEICRSLHVFI